MNVLVLSYQLCQEVGWTDEGQKGHGDIEGKVRERDLDRILRVDCDHHQHWGQGETLRWHEKTEHHYNINRIVQIINNLYYHVRLSSAGFTAISDTAQQPQTHSFGGNYIEDSAEHILHRVICRSMAPSFAPSINLSFLWKSDSTAYHHHPLIIIL